MATSLSGFSRDWVIRPRMDGRPASELGRVRVLTVLGMPVLVPNNEWPRRFRRRRGRLHAMLRAGALRH